MSRTLTLALASATAVAAFAPAALAAPTPDSTDSAAVAAADPVAAAAAATYLADQVDADGNLGGPGSTADAVLALVAAGGHDELVEQMTDYLEDEAEGYATDGGPAAGKLALVAAATDRDATDFGGVDLIAAIQGSISADGVCGSWAFAFGNALCILGLDTNGAEVPANLLTNSYGFQDPETGAFGYFAGSSFVAEADASGLMLTALAGVAEDRDAALSAARVRDYLVDAQDEAGYWPNYSPVNATGLVAPALQTVGVPQDAAVTWLAGQQLADGGLPNVIDGTTSNVMATTQGMLPLTGQSYLSAAGGPASVDLVVNPAVVERLSGEDRYGTAAAASADAFEPGVDTVYVATGQVYADALTGSALAGSRQAPVLLAKQNVLPQATADELARLAPQQVVVLGGPNSISTSVLTQIGQAADAPVTRLAGDNRYGTAAAVAGEFATADHVLVATGAQYADALAASAAAGADDVPVLLVSTNAVPSETVAALDRLEPGAITIVGGTNSVSEQVQTALGQHADEVTRIAGNDRYATAAALASSRDGGDGAVLATGEDYPDALTGAAYAAQGEVPVLLLRANSIPAVTSAELTRTAAAELVVFGGTNTVSEAVLAQLEALNYAE